MLILESRCPTVANQCKRVQTKDIKRRNFSMTIVIIITTQQGLQPFFHCFFKRIIYFHSKYILYKRKLGQCNSKARTFVLEQLVVIQLTGLIQRLLLSPQFICHKQLHKYCQEHSHILRVHQLPRFSELFSSWKE